MNPKLPLFTNVIIIQRNPLGSNQLSEYSIVQKCSAQKQNAILYRRSQPKTITLFVRLGQSWEDSPSVASEKFSDMEAAVLSEPCTHQSISTYENSNVSWNPVSSLANI